MCIPLKKFTLDEHEYHSLRGNGMFFCNKMLLLGESGNRFSRVFVVLLQEYKVKRCRKKRANEKKREGALKRRQPVPSATLSTINLAYVPSTWASTIPLSYYYSRTYAYPNGCVFYYWLQVCLLDTGYTLIATQFQTNSISL